MLLGQLLEVVVAGFQRDRREDRTFLSVLVVFGNGYGNGISWERQCHEEAVSAQNYGPMRVPISARSELHPHPLAEQAQACGRLTKEGRAGGPDSTYRDHWWLQLGKTAFLARHP